MPILGVSDRGSVEPRFKNIGKLRKGGPKRNGQFGLDLDHFRFTSEQSEVVSAFYEAYGKQPARLDVFLPYDEMECCFSSWRELYGSNGLCKCRCDGSHWIDWIFEDKHHHGYRPCAKEFCDTENRCPECPLKPVGRLSVILPALWAAGHIGLVTVETHSWNDIAHLSAKLTQWEPLSGKPFTLWREQVKIGAPIDGRRAAVNKQLVKIELTDSYLQDVFNSDRQRAIEAVTVPALPEPEQPDTDETDQFVVAEFGTATEPEQEPHTEPHLWSADEAKTITSWWRNELVITDAKALEYLGVSKISEFVGDYTAAQAVIKAQVSLEAKEEGSDG